MITFNMLNAERLARMRASWYEMEVPSPSAFGPTRDFKTQLSELGANGKTYVIAFDPATEGWINVVTWTSRSRSRFGGTNFESQCTPAESYAAAREEHLKRVAAVEEIGIALGEWVDDNLATGMKIERMGISQNDVMPISRRRPKVA